LRSIEGVPRLVEKAGDNMADHIGSHWAKVFSTLFYLKVKRIWRSTAKEFECPYSSPYFTSSIKEIKAGIKETEVSRTIKLII
jgi:hypothetical protein